MGIEYGLSSIYNSRSNSYELRYIINNKIYWNMSIGEDNFNPWKFSYITYKNSIINQNKNKTTGPKMSNKDEHIINNNLNIYYANSRSIINKITFFGMFTII